MSPSHYVFDIEVYDEYGDAHWAQARYLVHGWEDVLWTNDLAHAINFLKASVEEVTEST